MEPLEFYKEKKKNKIWRVSNPNRIGQLLFSFDGKTTINLWIDYPGKLTKEQKELFDKENPYWAEFFKDRK